MATVRIALKELMEREKLAGRPYTQEDIAERVGMAQGTLSRWVGNRVDRIEIKILAKLCAYFGVSVGELLVFEDSDR